MGRLYTRWALAEAQNWRCAYCNCEMEAAPQGPSSLSREHVVPVARGGSDDWRNLVAACVACNRARADVLTPELFLEYRQIWVESGVWPAGQALPDRIAVALRRLAWDTNPSKAQARRDRAKAFSRNLGKIKAQHARMERMDAACC
jgi:hypothetical protein